MKKINYAREKLLEALNWFDEMVEEVGLTIEERKYQAKLYELLSAFIIDKTKVK